MVVGVCRVSLLIPQASSLKDKRQVLRKIKDRVQNQFHVSIAEVANNDLWQRATLGISVVGNEHAHINSWLDKIINFIDQLYVAQIVSHDIEMIDFPDEESW